MDIPLDKILIIGVIGVLLLGPQRLPMYAQKLAEFVKAVRRFADTAKERMRDEMGPEFDDIEWQKLDPRQYDPRRIVKQALMEPLEDAFSLEDKPSTTKPAAGAAAMPDATGSAADVTRTTAGIPWDPEAT